MKRYKLYVKGKFWFDDTRMCFVDHNVTASRNALRWAYIYQAPVIVTDMSWKILSAARVRRDGSAYRVAMDGVIENGVMQ